MILWSGSIEIKREIHVVKMCSPEFARRNFQMKYSEKLRTGGKEKQRAPERKCEFNVVHVKNMNGEGENKRQKETRKENIAQAQGGRVFVTRTKILSS